MGTTNAQAEQGNVKGTACGKASASSIEAFFAESVILVTGATGFLGKALVEKLLRSCPQLATIFVLIRPKKDQTVEQRFSKLMDNEVFDKIRWESSSTLKKVVPIKGDVSMPDLGLSLENKAMLIERVNIVFHSAATVKFNEPLKVAVALNTRGTDRIIDLSKEMKNLISFIHVSTAYSNADRREVKEMVYKTNIKPNTLMDMCENLDDETINAIERRLMGKHPNTYTLTKSLAEEIVRTKGQGLPIAIVRPSIVCAAYKEPFPGWIDNMTGITGIMTEISKGTVRSIVCDESLMVDMIPIDFVIDTIICAAWHSTVHRSDIMRVYNCTSSHVNPVKWHEFRNYTIKHSIDAPSKYVMWYPNFTMRTNKLIHKFMTALFHFLPAFIMDLILRFQGVKPCMVTISKRVARAAKTAEYFATHEWVFSGNNITELVEAVKALKDSNRFNLDIRIIDWDSYIHQYILGIRKYILKDSPDSLNTARNRLLKLYWIHKIAQISSIFILLAILARTTFCR